MFERYLVAEAPDRDAAQALARRLHDLPEVEEAYVEGGPRRPAVSPDDDPRSANQGYLAAAPDGIDARWAWSVTDGDGIGYVDVEQGWTLNHEDLAGANITLLSGVNQAYPGHGTAVLGEVLAVDNTRGDIGIAPRASGRVVSQFRTSSTYNTAAAILSAAGSMRAGDVMLLEAQTTVAGSTFLPVETETGGVRCNQSRGRSRHRRRRSGRQRIKRPRRLAQRRRKGPARIATARTFANSGAILVGAAGAAAPHGRLGFSNFGSRIDCYAWGKSIDTTGDGWTGNATNTYTTGFGGTSGATPIIAGAALLLQSWRKRRGHAPYGPNDVRSLLSDARTGTASANPAADRIGVMPDLRALIERLAAAEDLSVVNDRFLETVFILFGLLNDSPGVIWVPGKGPVPVDPGWGGRVLPARGPLRDALAALAVSEVAGRMENAGSRAALAAAAAAALRVAADQIGRRG